MRKKKSLRNSVRHFHVSLNFSVENRSDGRTIAAILLSSRLSGYISAESRRRPSQRRVEQRVAAMKYIGALFFSAPMYNQQRRFRRCWSWVAATCVAATRDTFASLRFPQRREWMLLIASLRWKPSQRRNELITLRSYWIGAKRNELVTLRSYSIGAKRNMMRIWRVREFTNAPYPDAVFDRFQSDRRQHH